MRKIYIFLITFFITVSNFGQYTINEIFFGTGTGFTGQFVEINGPAPSIIPVGWSLEYYNFLGNHISSQSISGEAMPGVIIDGKSLLVVQPSQFGLLVTAIALVGPSFIQFLNQGTNTIIANNGPIAGEESTLIGSLDLNSGISYQYTDNGWVKLSPPSPGSLNDDQTTLPVRQNEIEDFAMYPNPVSNGELYLTSRDRAEKQVEIYALTGQQVYSKKVGVKETMNISSLTSGMYIVRIEEEGKIATRKLVIN